MSKKKRIFILDQTDYDMVYWTDLQDYDIYVYRSILSLFSIFHSEKDCDLLIINHNNVLLDYFLYTYKTSIPPVLLLLEKACEKNTYLKHENIFFFEPPYEVPQLKQLIHTILTRTIEKKKKKKQL